MNEIFLLDRFKEANKENSCILYSYGPLQYLQFRMKYNSTCETIPLLINIQISVICHDYIYKLSSSNQYAQAQTFKQHISCPKNLPIYCLLAWEYVELSQITLSYGRWQKYAPKLYAPSIGKVILLKGVEVQGKLVYILQ